MSSMGDRIKRLRESLSMTQEELGEKLGVQKSVIRKYESGMVENIKRSSIKIMADLFDVSPCYLMGWDEDEEQVQQMVQEVKLIEQIQSVYGKNAVELLAQFDLLTTEGKDKVISYAVDLGKVESYVQR